MNLTPTNGDKINLRYQDIIVFFQNYYFSVLVFTLPFQQCHEGVTDALNFYNAQEYLTWSSNEKVQAP